MDNLEVQVLTVVTGWFWMLVVIFGILMKENKNVG